MNPVTKLILTGIICASIVAAGAVGIWHFLIKEGQASPLSIDTLVAATVSKARAYSAAVPFSEPNAPKDTPNPINGELFTKADYNEMKTRYPIAVMIENHTDSRPSAGINSADWVYEALAEGGITRTMAVFWGHRVEEIGSVRSARVYFIEWMMPYDALYTHIGYALTSDPRTNAGGMIYEYGVKSLDKYGTFWRVTHKFAPHNAYTSTDLLYEKAEDYGYTGTPAKIESLTFKRDAALEQRGQPADTLIQFFERLHNGGLYDVTWKYDRDRNVYLRYNYETPYTDELTGAQVYAKNVIIQRMETLSSGDGGARMIITTIGEGDAIILRDGVVIDGTWKKDDISKRTHYYDSEGKEIELNRGVTWVESVPIDQGSVQVGT